MAETWITGIYPRSERLIEATRRYDRNLRKLFREEKKRIIKLQTGAGLDYVSDPLIDWDDMMRPFTDGMQGASRGALDRFYETNNFYRRMIISGELKTSGEILSNSLSLDLMPKRKPWKVDLFDPYTFASLSEDRFYGNNEKLMFAFASALAKEIGNIEKRGSALVQFNAPSLAQLNDRDTIAQAREAMRIVTKRLKGRSCLHLYFGDVSSNLDKFLDFPTDVIGVDFIRTKLDSVRGVDLSKGLACACIDAQNTVIERPSQIANFVRRASESVNPKGVSIIPNCDLEYVPQPFARRKILSMGKAARALRKEGL